MGQALRRVREEPDQEPLKTDPAKAAKDIGLRYVNDAMPGIKRRRTGRSFSFYDHTGQKIGDPDVIKRIRSLVLPPAWKDVWICRYPNGHLQATGIDARGRKQYRYHPKWRAFRDETKYGRMVAFGRALPVLRARVEQDLRRQGLPREKILATIVRLLQDTLIRIGNREYVKQNKSFGLTTLRNRHIAVEKDVVHFEFKAKSGIMRSLDLKDRRLARIVKSCKDLPGQDLFQYIDEDGARHGVGSDDVNRYIKDATGQDFTAKDFRTWSGTVLAALSLKGLIECDSEAAAKRNIVRAIEIVAGKLGNTVSICRKCYIHPAVLDAYLDGSFHDALCAETGDCGDLSADEAAVLAFLQNRQQAA
jgi:DNA topoisomerase-1